MKHAIILAHPAADSLNAAVAKAYAETLRSYGEEVVVRDLYGLGFDPCLTARELPWAKDHAVPAEIAAERALLADVQAFAFVYPLWINLPPAMLKGYVDRVFGMGFAYGPASGGTEPLLRGRSMVSLTTSGAPDFWVRDTAVVETLRRAFDDHLAAVTGLSVLDHVNLGGVTPGITREAGDDILDAARAVATRHFGPAK